MLRSPRGAGSLQQAAWPRLQSLLCPLCRPTCRSRLADLEARAEAAEAAKIELSLKVAELAAAATEADVDAAPRGRGPAAAAAADGGDGEGSDGGGTEAALLQRAEAAELAAAAAGRRAAEAEAEVDKLQVGSLAGSPLVRPAQSLNVFTGLSPHPHPPVCPCLPSHSALPQLFVHCSSFSVCACSGLSSGHAEQRRGDPCSLSTAGPLTSMSAPRACRLPATPFCRCLLRKQRSGPRSCPGRSRCWLI